VSERDDKALASELFNYVWQLLEKPDRSARETELMIHAAHGSRFLWEQPGEPVNHARGEWQISRAYASAGRAAEARHHGQLCLEICKQHGIAGFDIAYAYEALARAESVAGDRDGAERYAGLARAAADQVEDGGDRKQLISDLDSI
jgi:hypothetical protein